MTCFVKANAVSLAYLVIGHRSLVDRSIRSLHAAVNKDGVTRQQWSSHLLVATGQPNEVPSGTGCSPRLLQCQASSGVKI